MNQTRGAASSHTATHDMVEAPEKASALASLSRLRTAVALAAALLAAGLGAASFVLIGDPVLAAGAAGAVAGGGIALQLILAGVHQVLRRETASMQQLWQERQSQLQDIAAIDDLTQLQNRRFFYERLQRELDAAARTKKPLSILMIDVDDLKAINDEFGHQVGDTVLRAFGRTLNARAGEPNVTARLGGDEFAVIMPGSDRRDADALAWSIWDELSQAAVCETDHASIFLGVSIGTGGYPWGGNDLDEIIHWADAKMYANKLERKGFKRATNGREDMRLISAVVDVLSTALDIRDKMTHRHARRVARMSAFMAREMQLSEDEVLQIEYAAALHDIGKIGVTDNILRKPSALDVDEWREMRRHSELGYQILNGIDFLRQAAEIVYSHHEKFDGTGYPRGLAGEEIALGARVFAVVDAYDAMTSRRPYRDPLAREAALEEIARHAGAQFDPEVVRTFLRMVQRNPDGFRDDGDEFGFHVVSSSKECEAHVRQPAELAAPDRR